MDSSSDTFFSAPLPKGRVETCLYIFVSFLFVFNFSSFFTGFFVKFFLGKDIFFCKKIILGNHFVVEILAKLNFLAKEISVFL